MSEQRPHVVVIGGGCSGAMAANRLRRRKGTLAPSFSAAARRAPRGQLTGLGVEVLAERAVAAVRPGAVVLADGAVLASAVTVWAGGFGVPDLARASGHRHTAAAVLAGGGHTSTSGASALSANWVR